MKCEKYSADGAIQRREKSIDSGVTVQGLEFRESMQVERKCLISKFSVKSVNPCPTVRRVAGVIRTMRFGMRRLILKLSLLCLCLLLSPGCKRPTDAKPADCDPGYHQCENDNTICCPDSTSHNIDFWQIDTLGSPLTWSTLMDVAIIDENNIWAVGEIIINEDDGTQTTYNAAHYDGEEWELIFFDTSPGINSPPRAIFTLDEENIWLGKGGLPMFFNGDTFHIFIPSIDGNPGQPSITKIWGTSSDNIFFIGGNGSIVHYDGIEFTAMSSGTDIDLYAITGTGYDNVWVSGWVNGSGDYRTALLHFDGNSWRKVVEMSPPYQVKEDSLSGWIRGVFTNEIDSVIVLTSKGLYKCPAVTNGEGTLIPGSGEILTSQMVGIDGTEENDLFIAGHFTRIIHYNGETFHEYEEIPYLGTPFGIDVSPDLIVIPGFLSSTAQAYVIRGVR